MLKYRIISALGIATFGVAMLWLDSRLEAVELEGFWSALFLGRESPPPGLMLALLIVVAMLYASRELHGVFRARQIETTYWVLVAVVLTTLLAMYVAPVGGDALAGVAIVATVQAVWFVAALMWHARHARVEGSVAVAGATAFATVYLGLLAGFYLAIRHHHSAWVVVAVVLVTKAADTGAYAAGKTLGRHKLFPWLSPNKTWEGLVGGVVLSVVVAVGLAWLSARFPALTTVYSTIDGERGPRTMAYDPAWAALGGAVIGLISVVGGMVLSMFKRDAGIKDSGSVFPGMGGMLDVLDTPLVVGPVAYWMLEAARA